MCIKLLQHSNNYIKHNFGFEALSGCFWFFIRRDSAWHAFWQHLIRRCAALASVQFTPNKLLILVRASTLDLELVGCDMASTSVRLTEVYKPVHGRLSEKKGKASVNQTLSPRPPPTFCILAPPVNLFHLILHVSLRLWSYIVSLLKVKM